MCVRGKLTHPFERKGVNAAADGSATRFIVNMTNAAVGMESQQLRIELLVRLSNAYIAHFDSRHRRQPGHLYSNAVTKTAPKTEQKQHKTSKNARSRQKTKFVVEN